MFGQKFAWFPELGLKSSPFLIYQSTIINQRVAMMG